jgi:hypothetical protein
MIFAVSELECGTHGFTSKERLQRPLLAHQIQRDMAQKPLDGEVLLLVFVRATSAASKEPIYHLP